MREWWTEAYFFIIRQGGEKKCGILMLYLKCQQKVCCCCCYIFSEKNQRNTVSSRLHTSHLKFESDFSKETIFEAEQVHLISNTVIHPHCPSTETICESRVWIQNFLDLFNLGHFPETLNNNTSYDKMFFFWLEHVSSGNWTGYHAN